MAFIFFESQEVALSTAIFWNQQVCNKSTNVINNTINPAIHPSRIFIGIRKYVGSLLIILRLNNRKIVHHLPALNLAVQNESETAEIKVAHKPQTKRPEIMKD